MLTIFNPWILFSKKSVFKHIKAIFKLRVSTNKYFSPKENVLLQSNPSELKSISNFSLVKVLILASELDAIDFSTAERTFGK
jgi:hypothetical protein